MSSTESLPPTPAGPPVPEALSPYFTGIVLDHVPHLLEESYGLRYQVYCVERQFLPAEKYPDQLEVDGFDRYSVHIGVLNLQREVVATARLVEMSGEGLPGFAHCSIHPDELPLESPSRRIVEVSRLSVSRAYNRRAGDDFFSLQGPTRRADRAERRGGGEIVMTLYKALYQESKRRRYTHWLAATERSLQRLVARYGFPFRQIGPETEYYGVVAPYLMDLSEFDRVIAGGRRPLLREFLVGLAPEFQPESHHAATEEHDDGAARH